MLRGQRLVPAQISELSCDCTGTSLPALNGPFPLSRSGLHPVWLLRPLQAPGVSAPLLVLSHSTPTLRKCGRVPSTAAQETALWPLVHKHLLCAALLSSAQMCLLPSAHPVDPACSSLPPPLSPLPVSLILKRFFCFPSDSQTHLQGQLFFFSHYIYFHLL